MAEREITVTLKLNDELTKQLVKAGVVAEGEAGKIEKKFKNVGQESDNAVRSIKFFEDNTKKSLMQTAQAFKGLSGNVAVFSGSVLRGDLPGAITSFTGLAITSFKTIGVQAALMTGGLSIAVGAIVVLVKKAIETNKELEEAQKRVQEGFIARQAIMTETIEDETEKAVEKRLQEGERQYDELLKLSNEEINLEKKKLKKLGEIGAFSSDEKIAEHKRLTSKIKELEEEQSADLKKIAASTERDIARIEKAARDEKERIEKAARDEKEKIAKAEKEAREKAIEIDLDEQSKIVDEEIKKRDEENKQAEEKRDKTIAKLDELSAAVIDNNNKIIDSDKKAAELRTIANTEAAGIIVGSLGAINTALKGNAELSKGLAIGETIINTAAAIMKATSQTGVLAPLVVPAIIAQGAAQLAVISAQKFAKGGDFVTSGPQMIMVGDNPGGRERVQVTPLSSQNYNGPQGGSTINMGNVYISGNADSSTVASLNQSWTKRAKELKRMIQDLKYARQLPSMA